MNNDRFVDHLERATCEAVEVARRFVTNDLSGEIRYRIQSEIFDASGAVKRLNQNGEVPVWIDIFVDSTEGRFTFVRLRFSSKTTATDQRLRYQATGYPPFQVCGPELPAKWSSLDEIAREKFDLNRPRPGFERVVFDPDR